MSETGAMEGPSRHSAGRIGGFGLAILTALILGAIAWGAIHFGSRRAPIEIVAPAAALAALVLFAIAGSALGFWRSARRAPDALFEGFADALGEACVVTDGRGRPVYANGAYYRLLGDAGVGRLVGVENLYTGYPDIAERIYRLSMAAREAKPIAEEFRLAPGSSAAGAKLDRPAWFKASVAPVPGRDGHTLWRLRDVGQERARQEDAFGHLQTIINYLDHAPAGFFSAEPTGRVAYINATLASWLGLDLARTTGGALRLADIMTEASIAVLRAIEPKPGAAATESFDLDLLHSDGHSVPASLFHRVDFDAQGAPNASRSLVFARDGQSPRPSVGLAEARLARLFGKAPIGLAEVDEHGVIRNANESFVALSDEARRGAALEAIAAPSHRKAIAGILAAAKAEDGAIHSADIVLAGARPRSVQLAVTALDGGAERIAVYALDTTENKTLETQLAQGQKMHAVGQLAGGVAHDFNNVLTAIIGFCDLLLVKHRPTDPAFNDIMAIKTNANRAANLVRQLLAFSRRQTLRPEVFTLTDVISDIGSLLGRLLGEKISFKTIHGRDLWPVKADINQFEQVIVNLAVNARDAMPKGGRLEVKTANVGVEDSREVEPSVMPPGEYVLCEIRDTGTGIPEEIRDKIWEPFFSTKDVGKGTGLGLATVYGIVKQTGGFIFCDSELGQGTAFRIYLPRHAGQPEPDVVEAKEEKKDAKRADLTGKGTILLVEDEDAVRTFAARALTGRGYTVVEAATGEQALDIVKAGKTFDLILSDVVMPEMDGPTLLKELRKRGDLTKIVFISGYAEDAFAKHLEGHEDFAYLQKPFSLKQLAQAVKDAIAA